MFDRLLAERMSAAERRSQPSLGLAAHAASPAPPRQRKALGPLIWRAELMLPGSPEPPPPASAAAPPPVQEAEADATDVAAPSPNASAVAGSPGNEDGAAATAPGEATAVEAAAAAAASAAAALAAALATPSSRISAESETVAHMRAALDDAAAAEADFGEAVARCAAARLRAGEGEGSPAGSDERRSSDMRLSEDGSLISGETREERGPSVAAERDDDDSPHALAPRPEEEERERTTPADHQTPAFDPPFTATTAQTGFAAAFTSPLELFGTFSGARVGSLPFVSPSTALLRQEAADAAAAAAQAVGLQLPPAPSSSPAAQQLQQAEAEGGDLQRPPPAGLLRLFDAVAADGQEAGGAAAIEGSQEPHSAAQPPLHGVVASSPAQGGMGGDVRGEASFGVEFLQMIQQVGPDDAVNSRPPRQPTAQPAGPPAGAAAAQEAGWRLEPPSASSVAPARPPPAALEQPRWGQPPPPLPNAALLAAQAAAPPPAATTTQHPPLLEAAALAEAAAALQELRSVGALGRQLLLRTAADGSADSLEEALRASGEELSGSEGGVPSSFDGQRSSGAGLATPDTGAPAVAASPAAEPPLQPQRSPPPLVRDLRQGVVGDLDYGFRFLFEPTAAAAVHASPPLLPPLPAPAGAAVAAPPPAKGRRDSVEVSFRGLLPAAAAAGELAEEATPRSPADAAAAAAAARAAAVRETEERLLAHGWRWAFTSPPAPGAADGGMNAGNDPGGGGGGIAGSTGAAAAAVTVGSPPAAEECGLGTPAPGQHEAAMTMQGGEAAFAGAVVWDRRECSEVSVGIPGAPTTPHR